jgi:CHAD domain-containing protein
MTPVHATPPHPDLARAIHDLSDGLVRDLGEAQAGTSVHGARRRIKRLRSLLRLIRPAIGENDYHAANGRLRAAADALAGRRRAEALVAAAAKLHAGHPSSRLRALVESHADDLVISVDFADAPRQALDNVTQFKAAMAEWALPDSTDARVMAAFLTTYRKARKLLAHGMETGDATELHEARKFVIHHLHHLELLGDETKAKPAKRLRDLESLREILGDLNDLDELQQLASRHDPALATATAHAASRRRRSLLKAATASSQRLFRRKARAFAKRIGVM